MRTDENKKLSLQWTKVIIANNILLRTIGCRYFLSLMRQLRPNWAVPHRNEIAKRYIPTLAELCDEKFDLKIKGEDEFCLSLEFDHWQDAIHRSVLAVVATFPDGERYLLSLEDVTLRGHSTNSIIKSLKKNMNQVPPMKFNAVMSDSASSCKKARSKLVSSENEQYMHTIQYRCQAHLFNLIGARMMADDDVEEMFSGANKLVSFISSQQALQALLTELGYKKLVKSNSVRWYSHVAMLESLLEVKDEAQQLFARASNQDCLNMRLLICEVFWDDVPKVIMVLRPLADCIAIAETSSGTLGESTKALLEYIKFLFNQDWQDSFVLSTIKSVLHYISEENLGATEFGLMLAAYLLDKINCMNYITKEGMNLAFDSIVDVAGKSGYAWSTIE